MKKIWVLTKGSWDSSLIVPIVAWERKSQSIKDLPIELTSMPNLRPQDLDELLGSGRCDIDDWDYLQIDEIDLKE